MAAEGEVSTQHLTVGITSGSLTPSETFTSLPTATLFWQDWGAEQYTFIADSNLWPHYSSRLLTKCGNDVGLDGVSVAPAAATGVPEPGSMTLLVSGLIGLIGIAKRSSLYR